MRKERAATDDISGFGHSAIRPTRTLLILTLVYTFGFLDRQIVTILAEPIKRDLHLHDWQLGIVTGLAFALFYSSLSLPVARFADRVDRPRLIGIALAIWSLFTAAGSLCTSFSALALVRFGVGIGEAGCTPPSHALIADLYPIEKRAGAIGIYAMGISLGTLLGLVVGGLVLDWLGWRAAFAIVGLPGLAIALLVLMLLEEPRAALRRFAPEPPPSFFAAVAVLGRIRTFRWIALASASGGFMFYAIFAFIGSFFFRSHPTGLLTLAAAANSTLRTHLGAAGLLGVSLGLATGISGALGTFLGGRLTDRLAGRDLRAYTLVPALATLLCVPALVIALLVPDTLSALTCFAVGNFIYSLGFPAAYGSVQALVGTEMRATASAVLLFGINLIGLGLGPLSVGALSDQLVASGLSGAAALQWALVAVCGVGVIGTGGLFLATTSFIADARRVAPVG